MRYLGMSLLDFEAERKRGMRCVAHVIIVGVGLFQLLPLFGNTFQSIFYIQLALTSITGLLEHTITPPTRPKILRETWIELGVLAPEFPFDEPTEENSVRPT